MCQAVINVLFCIKRKSSGETKVPEATSNSSSQMLTLSIHLNHLITWITTIFTVALAFRYFDNPKSSILMFYGIVSGVNALISCLSGFWISTYLIKNLEESVSEQILSVFA